MFSDYDILIVTKKTFSPKAKRGIKSRIHKTLVDSLELPFDILLNSEKEIEFKRQIPGHVLRSAMNEAIEL